MNRQKYRIEDKKLPEGVRYYLSYANAVLDCGKYGIKIKKIQSV